VKAVRSCYTYLLAPRCLTSERGRGTPSVSFQPWCNVCQQITPYRKGDAKPSKCWVATFPFMILIFLRPRAPQSPHSASPHSPDPPSICRQSIIHVSFVWSGQADLSSNIRHLSPKHRSVAILGTIPAPFRLVAASIYAQQPGRHPRRYSRPYRYLIYSSGQTFQLRPATACCCKIT